MHYRPGDVLPPQFRLETQLGVGGFSEVWSATDLQARDKVAIKIFLKQDQEGIDLCREEYLRMTYLRHPNILQPRYFSSANGAPYIVMPLCEIGSTMNKLGEYSERQLAQMIAQIGAALGHIHAMGQPILHNNIKPDNILEERYGSFVLADFGISEKLSRKLRQIPPEDDQRTPMMDQDRREGVIPMAYRAPEMFNYTGWVKMPPSKATDVWAFGATLYQIASGELPFDTEGGLRQLTYHNASNNLTIEDILPDLPAQYSGDLSQMLKRCMAFKPNDRPSAEDMANWARNYLQTGNWHTETIPLSSTTHTQQILMPERVDLHQGDQIGTFRVEEQIGEGAFNAVYKVQDLRDGKIYALKLLKLWSTDRRTREDLIQRKSLEFQIGSTHSSDFLMPYYSRGIFKGNPFHISKFMSGGNFRSKLNEELSIVFTEQVAFDVLNGLGSLHQLGYVHRDVKPEQVLFGNFGQVVKIDGSSIASAIGKPLEEVDWRGKPKDQVGTWLYMPSEQINPKNRKEASQPGLDIFAFGVTMYEAFTGYHPFGGLTRDNFDKDLATLISRVQSGVYDLPSTYNVDIPNYWLDIFEGCFQPDYRNRFQNANAILNILTTNSRHLGAKAEAPKVYEEPAPRITIPPPPERVEAVDTLKPKPPKRTSPVRIFISYSHKDEAHMDDLREHLSPLLRLNKAELWDDRAIDAGSEWEQEIHNALHGADIVLCLISAAFIRSEYCYGVELTKALENHRTKHQIVLPILLRKCGWEELEIAEIQGTPTKKWITQHTDKDEAWNEVYDKVKKVVQQLWNS